jgi:NADH-quinone oxidoreductase subunit C
MTPEEIKSSLEAKFPEAVAGAGLEVLQPFLKINPAMIYQVCQFLRDEDTLNFDYLMNLSALDLGENLGLVYHLTSLSQRHKIVLKTEVSKEQPNVHSVADLWRTADWHEREAYDLLGVVFVNHPDLRRILLPEDWVGYPLRKDYQTPEYYNGLRVPFPEEQGDLYDEE